MQLVVGKSLWKISLCVRNLRYISVCKCVCFGIFSFSHSLMLIDDDDSNEEFRFGQIWIRYIYQSEKQQKKILNQIIILIGLLQSVSINQNQNKTKKNILSISFQFGFVAVEIIIEIIMNHTHIQAQVKHAHTQEIPMKPNQSEKNN